MMQYTSFQVFSKYREYSRLYFFHNSFSNFKSNVWSIICDSKTKIVPPTEMIRCIFFPYTKPKAFLDSHGAYSSKFPLTPSNYFPSNHHKEGHANPTIHTFYAFLADAAAPPKLRTRGWRFGCIPPSNESAIASRSAIAVNKLCYAPLLRRCL